LSPKEKILFNHLANFSEAKFREFSPEAL